MLQSTIATNSTSGRISLFRDLNFAFIRVHPFVVEPVDGKSLVQSSTQQSAKRIIIFIFRCRFATPTHTLRALIRQGLADNQELATTHRNKLATYSSWATTSQGFADNQALATRKNKLATRMHTLCAWTTTRQNEW
jgi:hypothetical protein